MRLLQYDFFSYTSSLMKSNRGNFKKGKVSDRRAAAGFRMSGPLNNTQGLKSGLSAEKLSQLKSKRSETTAKIRSDPKSGRTWKDHTLSDWDPKHYRLFVGNLSDDVDEIKIIESFVQYKSLSKVKVVTGKGYGFVSFADADDYLKCYREMKGVFVGQKPITLDRAKTEIQETVSVKRNQKGNRR